MRFEDKFAKIVEANRSYYSNIVKKLEDVFDGIILHCLYEYPQTILDMLEQESNIEWDDQIWEAVYNDTPCNKILQMIEDKRKKEKDKKND